MPFVQHAPSQREPAAIRYSVAIAALLALFAFGWRMDSAILCGTAAAVTIASTFSLWRWEMTRRAERISIGLLALPFLLGAIASFFSEENGPFRAGPSLAGQFLVCLLILDFSLESVRRRTSLLLAISFGILVLGGSARWGREFNRFYHGIAAAFAFTALLYLRTQAAAAWRHGTPPRAAPEVKRASPPLAIPLLLAVLMTVSIARFLPWAQGHVERAYADIDHPELSQISAFAWNPRLGSMGHILKSDRPVMRVFSDRARLLRGRVLTTYEAAAWKSPVAPNPQVLAGPLRSADAEAAPGLADAPGTEFPLPRMVQSPPDTGPIRTLRAIIDRQGLGVFFAPFLPSVVKSDAPSVWIDPSGCLYPGGSPSELEYAVGYRETPDGPEARHPVTPLTPEETLQQTALPAAHRTRFEELAREWCPESAREDPEAAARALTTRLQSECRYSLDFMASGKEREPLLDFCLHRHKGQCEYFASAFVILMRGLGHPARYVTGLAMTEWNRSGGYWLVREQDAHAWAEVFLPGRGWVTMDPTPGGATTPRETPGTLAGWWDSWRLVWIRFWMRFDKLTWGERLASAIEASFAWVQTPIHAAAIGTAVVLFGLWRWSRQRRSSRAALEEQTLAAGSDPEWLPPARGALAELWAALKALGLQRRTSETLHEFASAIPEDRVEASLRLSLSNLLARYSAWRYGGRTPTAEEREVFAREASACAERLRVSAPAPPPGR